jgi:sarcosine oxidase, subunit gamma
VPEVKIQFDAHPARNKIRLRVMMAHARAAAERLQLPDTFEAYVGSDATSLWLGPDQWMFVSDHLSSASLISHATELLGPIPHHAVDVSSAFYCVRLRGARVRDLLSMGSGVNWDRVLRGQCRRTRFARIAILAHAVEPDTFEIYFDRSYRAYLEAWLAHASSDPLLSTPPCHSSS